MVISNLRRRSGFVALAIAALCCFSPATFAALIVDFKSLPISPSDPEVVWSGGSLVAAPTANGSQGNGDGTLPLAQQTVGGLIIETPFVIIAPELGGTIGLTSTTFSDVTLILNGLNAAGNASLASGLVNQPLSGGTFRLVSTHPAAAPGTDLLDGTITSANISGLDGTNAGSVLSGNVTYTGGVIYSALLGTTLSTTGGSLSFSLLDLNTPLSINPNTNQLSDFTANATGQFGTPAVPEPASLSLIALGACGLLIRRPK